MPRPYRVKCQLCNAIFEDDGFVLDCPNHPQATALLLTDYPTKRFEPDSIASGIFRYRHWLPIDHLLRCSGRTVTYQSQTLCRRLNLPNLWIAFNGDWFDKGAMLETATFKELEAYAVLSRLPKQHPGALVVASAGNTAAAFASVCSQNQTPCLLIVPSSGLAKLTFRAPLDPCVRIVSLMGAEYDDAIQLAERLSHLDRFFLEGGVRNIGRRDGIGTTLLQAVETIGQLPDYYFQAIGSGAGAIAVHEAAKRLVWDGRFGQNLPRLMLSQNFPFMPIYTAWKSQQRQLIEDENGKQKLQQILAGVLSNQRPPYTVTGGVYDVLKESQGDMFFADNQEALAAMELFWDSEGVEIEPAAGVAFASLLKAVRDDRLDGQGSILLHVTGGRCQESRDRARYPVQPTIQLNASEFSAVKILEELTKLF